MDRGDGTDLFGLVCAALSPEWRVRVEYHRSAVLGLIEYSGRREHAHTGACTPVAAHRYSHHQFTGRLCTPYTSAPYRKGTASAGGREGRELVRLTAVGAVDGERVAFEDRPLGEGYPE